MCRYKVSVSDLLHRGIHNFYNCGHCKSCLASKANRRSSRIRNHHPNGYTCYFITLSYSDKYVPYVLKSDLCSALEFLHGDEVFDIPIYRDFDVITNSAFKSPYKLYHPIDTVTLTKYCSNEDFKTLSGLHRPHPKYRHKFYVDDSRISVCYTPDFQKFINRFRQSLFRRFKKRVEVSYYYAPEYGPTSQRFHIHLLLWLPSYITESSVRSFVVKTWPYADSKRTSMFCEVARNPARYVSQYVNSGSDVSNFLLTHFPLRPSHSLGFGFDNKFFSLSNLLSQWQRRNSYKYPIVRYNANGSPISDNAFYPSHVIYRYFPKIKGFYRCSRTSLLHAYQDPEKYLSLSPYPCGLTDSGDILYMSNLVDIFGHPIPMTLDYRDSFIKRLYNTYHLYYEPLNISYLDYTLFVYHYLVGRANSFLKDAASSNDLLIYSQSFYNPLDVLNSDISNHLVTNHIELDSNKYPLVVEDSLELEEQYDNNIKQRKINSL